MVNILTRSMNDQMLSMVDLYLSRGGRMPIDLDELAQFAIREGLWETRRCSIATLQA